VLVDLLRAEESSKTLVFSRTKHGANRIVRMLDQAGIEAVAIHGNKSQSARVRALEGFRAGSTPVLVATDIAARGLDVEGVTLVINFDVPNVPETYVHRIGRTARAGASGRALSLCDGDERALLRDIERLIGRQLTRVPGHDHPSAPSDVAPARPAGRVAGRPSRSFGRRRPRSRGTPASSPS
jgi:ATP-dependent RNA helicase RhlE